MTDFLSYLPCPTRLRTDESIVEIDPSLASYSIVSSNPVNSLVQSNNKALQRKIPKYGSRQSWIPRCQDDFGDGGAYPEIIVAQFPLNMGHKSEKNNVTVALQTGEDGKLQYDAVIRQNLEHRTAIYTRPESLKPQWSNANDLQKPNDEETKELEDRTRTALSQILAKKMSLDINKSVNQKPEYIRYTPSDQGSNHNANCQQRIVRMVEAQRDPMEPPKFQHKRVPAGPPSPPPAILHSPPRKLSAADQALWKIPPCVSNWKNQKGYTIPLDKRLQADGRCLQEMSINDKFASLSESLYIAERAAREEIRLRNELLKQKKQQEEILREEQLRDLAAKARQERAGLFAHKQKNQETADTQFQHKDSNNTLLSKRRDIEFERRREVERDLRLERAGKRSKHLRDEQRDISEKIALGQAKPTSQTTLFDSRLFNQSAGLDTGYNGGSDDKYNVYDKPLFVDRSKDILYRYDQDRMAQSLGSIGEVPSFAGADTSRQRTAPVEFEADSADPFGLASFIENTTKK